MSILPLPTFPSPRSKKVDSTTNELRIWAFKLILEVQLFKNPWKYVGSVVRIKETIEYACNIVEIKVFKTQMLLEILIRRFWWSCIPFFKLLPKYLLRPSQESIKTIRQLPYAKYYKRNWEHLVLLLFQPKKTLRNNCKRIILKHISIIISSDRSG